MAKTKISEFDSNPVNNTDIDGINLAEGMAPGLVNNALRELMAQLKEFQDGSSADSFTTANIIATGGSVNGTTVGASTASTGAFTTLTASADSSFTSTGAVQLPSGTTGQRPTGAAGKLRFNSTTTQFEGFNGSAWASVGSADTFKSDSNTVVFTKTGAGTVSIKAGTTLTVGATLLTFATATAVVMPTLTAGTDYAIYGCTDGTLRADANFSAPSGYTTANSRKIGGFHYAPGGNATGTSGGDTTPAINEYSLWDLKRRPACPDPRGMTLVADGFWADIYLTGVDAITNGSSKYNVTMADGSSPPKVPTMFGGNGSTTYGSYTWFEAQELAMAFGKRSFTQQEFMAAAYGTTEASAVGSDQGSTILNAAYTSKWGVIQAAGVLRIWGRERGGPYASASWNANTEGRGSEYSAPNASVLGGYWDEGSAAGSRCSRWSYAASGSSGAVGSRFACDHLQLD